MHWRADMKDFARYFTRTEAECGCGCGFIVEDRMFIARLDLARTMAGIPFRISSWCRCPGHNRCEGGHVNSGHLHGIAADIFIPHQEAQLRTQYGLLLAGFQRVGIGDNFIHVDIVGEAPSPCLFFYC